MAARPQEGDEMPHYSAGQAIDSLGFGRFQIYLSAMVGFAYMADAMEMMILSILGPALHCEWHITGKTASNLVDCFCRCCPVG